MPEIKHSFTGGKMNKDLDERLLKNGEYRHATNIQVRTTDSQDADGVGNAGTIQNLQGNELMGSSYMDTWMTSNITMTSDLSGQVVINSWGPNKLPKCVASIADEKKDRGYFFYASYPYLGASIFDNDFPVGDETIRHYVDSIWEQSVDGTKTPVLIDNYTTVCTFFGAVQSYDATTNPYLAGGWSELYMTNTDHLRAGMKVTIYAGNGEDVVNNELVIKAVDHDSNTILFHEAVYVTLDPSICQFIVFESPRVLNLTPGSKTDRRGIITGVNVIDDFLMWTDGSSEPKKIHIPRCKAGTNLNNTLNDGKTHTKLYLNDPNNEGNYVDANTLSSPVGVNGNDNGGGWDTNIKEEHITVIRKSPRSAPTLIMKDVERASSPVQFSGTFVSGDEAGVKVGEIKRFSSDNFLDTSYRPNDILAFTFTGMGAAGGVMKVKFICYEDSEGNEVTETTANIRVSIVRVLPEVTSTYQSWEITLDRKKPLFELKLGRFGYRYKYEDGEYSSFSPWSELAFLPSDFDYVISKAYNLGMTNTVRELVIKDFIPYNIPLDVTSVDILYKTTSSANVYILETIDKVKSPEWELYTPTGTDDYEIKTGELVVTSEMIHRVLPSTQTLRSWDNVPRFAKAQEVIGNRLLFGNYIQGFNINSTVNLTQNVISSNIVTTEENQPPHKSIKSIRDYKVGMVFGDKYGRETPVMTGTYAFTTTAADFDGDGVDDDVEVSTTGDITVEKTLCANQNSIVVKQDWSATPDSWIDYVKYYVKETSNEYYNLIMDRWYDSGDGTVWLSFNSADRNKVDLETYLLLKNKHGSQEPVLEKARYKIIAIENEAPDYIKETRHILGEVGEVTQADNCPGCGGLDETAGSTDGVWLTGQTANSAPPNGFINETSCIISAAHWTDAFGDASLGAGPPYQSGFDQVGGVGKVYIRIVGKSWKQDEDGVMYNAFQRNSQWMLLTNHRIANSGASVKITWAEKFGMDADMYSYWGTSGDGEATDINGYPLVVADLVYSIEFLEVEVENKPEFDGKFFVKIEQDEVLRQGVMSFGLNNQWLPQGTYSLAYISSTVDNEATVGPYSSVPAKFGQSANGTTNAYDDGDSYSWFQYKFPNATMSRNTGGDWETDGDDSLFENRVLDWCGIQTEGRSWGPWGGTIYSADDIVMPGISPLGARLWDYTLNGKHFMGWPVGDTVNYDSDYRGFEACTCIGSSANGGSVTDTWYHPSHFPCGAGYTVSGDGNTYDCAGFMVEISKFQQEDASDEFNVAANYGVMGSCTYHANAMTKNFWKAYRVNDGPTTIKYWNGDNVPHLNDGGGGLAFIDGSRARYMRFPSFTDSDYPHFYKPDSMSIGTAGVVNGVQTYGQMTISRGSSGSDDAVQLYSLLTTVDKTFKWGAQDTIYQIIDVEFAEGKNGSEPTNFSTSKTGNVMSDVDFGGSVGEVDMNGEDILLEQCKPCDEGGYSGYKPNPHPQSVQQEIFYLSMDYYSSGNDTYLNSDHFNVPECFRKTARVTFRKLNSISGEPILADDGMSDVGLDLSTWDPRGEMHHDGRDSVAVTEVKAMPIIYNDDSNKNELGACWETEPKEDADLDIYYEASNAIPLVLNKDNVFDFAPINSKIQSFRETDDGIVEVEVYQGGGGLAYDNIRIANVHMSTDSEQAIVCVIRDAMYGYPGVGVLHTYDLLNLTTPHLDVGDWMVITHPNGTVTRAKVEDFWELIDDSPGSTIFEDVENPGEIDPLMGTQLLSGPKAFRKTSTPTGYYGISINVAENEVQLPWFNCYAFGNGVESDRIRDDYNAPQIDNGVRVSTTFSGYGEEHIGSGMIYSGIYNSTSQVNDLNEFNMSQKITKELNPSYGSIQRLRARDTDMVVFTEDKVLRLLANKDAVFNADGNPQLTATDRVLGTPIPYAGDFGISKNPESLAWDQYRMYFTDKQRGAVLRLSRDGLTPISDVGMRSWFRNNIHQSDYLIGSFDIVQGEYNLHLENNKPGSSSSTISFNEASKGWVSFKSFKPNQGLSISGKYITAKDNSTWLHYSDNVNRNNFYGMGSVNSVLKFIFNEQHDVVKSFKAINYTGSQARVNQFLGANVISYTGEVETTANASPTFENIVASLTTMVSVTDGQHDNLVSRRGWYVSHIETDLEKGNVVDFKNKEGKWFQGISGKQISWDHGTHLDIQTDQFSVQGIGVVGNVTYIPDDDIDGNEDDCVPPCPVGYTCIEGECVETYQEIAGCMDPLASNYCGPGNTLGEGGTELEPVCNVPNNSTCVYNVQGCMDPMAPNYNSFAESTVDNPSGTVGDYDWTYYTNGYPTCWPFCTDCSVYQYGCNLTVMNGLATLNYSAGNTTDGYCQWEGVVVPCPPSQDLDSSSDTYNGDAWANADDMGKIDLYVVEPGYSCVIQNCPDPEQIWTPGCTESEETCCVDCVYGCTDSAYDNYNPAATCDDGSCYSDNYIIGCMDTAACNYDENATQQELGSCDYNCVGCLDPLAYNYNGPPVGNSTIACDDCCCYSGQEDCSIPGCLDPMYQEFCGDDPGNANPQWQQLGMESYCEIPCWAGGPCGAYTNNAGEYAELGDCQNLITVGVPGCMDDGSGWTTFPYTVEVNNYCMECTSDDGSCTYTIYACLDENDYNYPPEGWVGWEPWFTAVNDINLCVNPIVPGCMDPNAVNYNSEATEEDGSCRPEIYGCTDPTAINYSPFHTIDEAGPNNWTALDPVQYADVQSAIINSWEYSGECMYWQCGCLDQYASNYDPTANTQIQMAKHTQSIYWWQTIETVNPQNYILADFTDENPDSMFYGTTAVSNIQLYWPNTVAAGRPASGASLEGEFITGGMAAGWFPSGMGFPPNETTFLPCDGFTGCEYDTYAPQTMVVQNYPNDSESIDSVANYTGEGDEYGG